MTTPAVERVALLLDREAWSRTWRQDERDMAIRRVRAGNKARKNIAALLDGVTDEEVEAIVSAVSRVGRHGTYREMALAMLTALRTTWLGSGHDAG